MSREAEATPGLQQLARVLTIQLQVLNGADDLCMHVPDHTTHKHTNPVQRGKERGEFGSRRREGKTIRKIGKTNKRRKEREKKNLKEGVIEHHC